jgi:flagellar protein FliS
MNLDTATHLPRSPHRGALAYARVGVETGVESASPQQLIVMLFDGAKSAIAMARHHMREGRVAAKGKAVSHAISIVESGLKASLDAAAAGPAGTELVANLAALYDYIVQRLMLANRRDDPRLLDEAERLLDDIGSAWRDIDGQRAGSSAIDSVQARTR